MGPIYQGAEGVHFQRAAVFVAKYWEDIPKHHEFHAPDYDEHDVQAMFRVGGKTAGGMDLWLPGELKQMPLVAARWKAKERRGVLLRTNSARSSRRALRVRQRHSEAG